MVICTQENTNIHRSGKALRTTLLIVGTFLLCWLPTCIFQVKQMLIVNIDVKQPALVDPAGCTAGAPKAPDSFVLTYMCYKMYSGFWSWRPPPKLALSQ